MNRSLNAHLQSMEPLNFVLLPCSRHYSIALSAFFGQWYSWSYLWFGKTLDFILQLCWAMNTWTTEDHLGLWKAPHLSLVLLTHHPVTGEKVMHGPLSFGAGTACTAPGERSYAEIWLQCKYKTANYKYATTASQAFKLLRDRAQI